MTSTQFDARTVVRRSATATAFGLALAVSGCSNGGADEAATASPPSPSAPGSPGVVGEMIIDNQPYELVQSYWCEPEAGFESGTTVTIRVAAYDESGTVIVYGLQVDEDGSDSTTSSVSVATDPDTNYSSEGLAESPTIVMESGAVSLRGGVYRSGREPVDLEAEFSLPAEPGFPGYC